MPASVSVRASPLSDKSQSSLAGRKRIPSQGRGLMTTEFCFHAEENPVLKCLPLTMVFMLQWCILDSVPGDLN